MRFVAHEFGELFISQTERSVHGRGSGSTVIVMGDVALSSDVDSAVPRERILSAAYRMFSQRGIRDVGVEELIAASGVAKATFYKHFRSKQDLVLAFLQRREQLWTWGTVEAGARARGGTADEQLLAIFDVFHDWFAREDFEACSFINVLLEMGAEHPAGRASVHYLEHIRAVVAGLAGEAGLRDTQEFARSWHILMKGSIISAAEGDAGAAQRAKVMAGWLIEHHRR